jgi:PAS domain S-box-containing protein
MENLPARIYRLFVVLITLSSFFMASPLSAADKVTLHLQWYHQFQFAGYYAALEQGYYRDAGLDVSIIEGGPGVETFKKVTSSPGHYGTAHGGGALLQRIKGQPLVVLAAIFQHSPNVIIARTNSGITTPHHLPGTRTIIWPGGHIEHSAMLLNEGIDPAPFLHEVRGDNLKDFIAGKVDAIDGYITNEVFSARSAGIPVNIIKPDNYGVDFYGDTLITSERELRDHQERLDAFREASLRGWKFALDHPQEIVDLLITKYKVTKAREHLLYEAEETKKLIRHDLVQIGHMNPGRWVKMANTLITQGMIDPGYSLQGFVYDPNVPKDRMVFLGPKFVPPYASNENGKPVGAYVDIATALGKALKRPVEMRLYQWADAQARLQRGEGHAQIAMVINEKRKEHHEFTQPTFDFDYMMFVKSNNLNQFNIRDLSKKRIAVRRGGYAFSIIENNHPEAKPVFVKTSLEGFRMLLKGDVDGVIDENLIGHHTLTHNEIQGIDVVLPPISKRTLHIAVPKGNPALLNELNEAISKLKSTGEIKEISQRWLDGPVVFITQSQKKAALIGVGGTLAIVATLAILLFFTVKKRNRDRTEAEKRFGRLENITTKSKQAKQVAEQRFKALFEQSGSFCMVLDPNTSDGIPVIVDVNKAACEAHGYTREELIGRPVADVDDEEGKQMVRERTDQMLNGKPLRIENTHVRKDGTTFNVAVYADRVDTEGELPLIFTTEHDITDQKKTEDMLNASLAEKEVMLKEIHHRVKNNLQVITSMLAMQARGQDDDVLAEALRESQRRVMTMARIHESLHQSDDLSSINAHEYLNALVEDIRKGNDLDPELVSLLTDIDPLILDIEYAISCGQIVSELLSNSVKHAFPNGRSGKIVVSLRQLDEGKTELTVADDGIGLPEDFDLDNGKSLGLQLVNAMVSKIHGSVMVDGSNGTRTKIIFREEHP